ncbi:DNA repair protein RadC [Candidatus Kirkpatrickella diaphorinae]|uniref:DNA repair protein RadC n=1 Tax=Candidatus Kirkpatrickella diaphorinae TaxID=2984322 RepID=A0ABY6GJU2_9PROT|nr:DNA repair protein RadC [Candidatus Kirkpatrickella diaphorinae]UYH51799.1 DNA repair protein RadC [Candidatus Kirkpatrickella diaphorinae]
MSQREATLPRINRKNRTRKRPTGSNDLFDVIGSGWSRVALSEIEAAESLPVKDDYDQIRHFLRVLQIPEDVAAAVSVNLKARFGSFSGLLCAPNEALTSVPNFPVGAIIAVRLVQEAAIRINRERINKKNVLADKQFLLDYLTSRLAREAVEQFRVIFLSDDGGFLADEAQAQGTVNHTPVYPREVARRAMELRAANLILVHNHPSGDPTPSGSDIHMTHQIMYATRLIGVDILDHLVIGKGRYASLKELGLLEPVIEDRPKRGGKPKIPG